MSRKLTESYIHVPHRKPISCKTIGERFNDITKKAPDEEMYVFYADKERTTFRQMQEESQKFARSLLKLGLKKGDVLGMWGNNHHEWILAHLASIQIGVITVNMRIDLPLSVQQEIIKKFRMKVLVLMRSPSAMCARASEIIPELLTNPADNLNCQGTPSLKYVVNAGTSQCTGSISLTDFMEIGTNVDMSDLTKAMEKVDFDDPCTVLFTSGSTGAPKAVTHSHKFMLVAEAFSRLEDADGNPLPLWTKHAHVVSFGNFSALLATMMPIIQGDTTVIVSPTFNVELVANAIQDERVTGTAMLIHHLNDFLSLPNKYDFSSFKVDYTATEAFVAVQSLIDPPAVLQSPAFRPIDGSEVKIVGENGQILPINEVGEICFRSLSLFMYYWGEEESANTAKKSDGWYHTGDLGTLDVTGYIRIIGRKAERIIKEGINIAPRNLEKVLDEHPAINNVVVVGVPDEQTSEEMCACIRLHPSCDVTTDELRDFCRGKVSDYFVPKYVLLMQDALPTTETGKFDRRRIGEKAKAMLM